MADPVRDVSEQEFLAPGHAEIADDEHVDGLLFGRRDDRPRWVGIDEDQPPTPLAGEAPRIAWELGASGVGARVIGGARR